jgi:hypothetical protein
MHCSIAIVYNTLYHWYPVLSVKQHPQILLLIINCTETLKGTSTSMPGCQRLSAMCDEHSYLCTYDLYSTVHNILDACIFITRASGRVGPWKFSLLGPVTWHWAYRRVPFGAPKTRNCKNRNYPASPPTQFISWFPLTEYRQRNMNRILLSLQAGISERFVANSPLLREAGESFVDSRQESTQRPKFTIPRNQHAAFKEKHSVWDPWTHVGTLCQSWL